MQYYREFFAENGFPIPWWVEPLEKQESFPQLGNLVQSELEDISENKTKEKTSFFGKLCGFLKTFGKYLAQCVSPKKEQLSSENAGYRIPEDSSTDETELSEIDSTNFSVPPTDRFGNFQKKHSPARIFIQYAECRKFVKENVYEEHTCRDVYEIYKKSLLLDRERGLSGDAPTLDSVSEAVKSFGLFPGLEAFGFGTVSSLRRQMHREAVVLCETVGSEFCIVYAFGGNGYCVFDGDFKMVGKDDFEKSFRRGVVIK
jgi:hypothetical protein